MQVNFNRYQLYNYSKIDSNTKRVYTNLGVPCAFKGRFDKVMYNKEEKINLLKRINEKYENLEKSPVAFIKPLIENLINEKISADEFCYSMKKESNFTKYCISKMSQSDIESLQQIFKNEFQLADKLNLAISENPCDYKTLIDKLNKMSE